MYPVYENPSNPLSDEGSDCFSGLGKVLGVAFIVWVIIIIILNL